MFQQWEGFKEGNWQKGIDVRNFIQKNYKEYKGDASFLAPVSEKTERVWSECSELIGQINYQKTLRNTVRKCQ